MSNKTKYHLIRVNSSGTSGIVHTFIKYSLEKQGQLSQRTNTQWCKHVSHTMESINLLSGNNTKKSVGQYEAHSFFCSKKTVWLGVVVLVVVGLVGYAFTMTPTASSATQSTSKEVQTMVDKDKETGGFCGSLTPREPTVLIYNRVPKAGSSSMTNLLSKLSSKHGFKMLGWFDLPSHDYESVQKTVREALKTGKKTVIAQHFHFPEIINDDVAYINVVREPVSRCTSQYYYLRYGDRNEKDRRKVLDRFGDMSIDECIGTGTYDSCFNCDGYKQSLFFCGRDGGPCKSYKPKQILEKAKRNIDLHYTVGAIEDFEGTVAVMEKLYPSFFGGGVELMKKVKPQRVTQGVTKEYIKPSNASKEIIQGLLEQDVALYKYVVNKLDHVKECLL